MVAFAEMTLLAIVSLDSMELIAKMANGPFIQVVMPMLPMSLCLYSLSLSLSSLVSASSFGTEEANRKSKQASNPSPKPHEMFPFSETRAMPIVSVTAFRSAVETM